MKYPLFISLFLLAACAARQTEETTSLTNEEAEHLIAETNEADTVVSVEGPDNDCVCAIRAYLDDPDDSGTNIRQTPNGKIIGQLHYEEDCDCLIVHFVRSKDGWLELQDGGWVYGGLFSVGTRNYGPGEKVYLHEFAAEESAIVAEYDREMTFSIDGCCGGWILVSVGDIRGWLHPDMSCGNPLTNCS